MQLRPIDITMARAQAHLSSARYPQAIGAFRAAVAIDSRVMGAHLGLADALVAEGRRYEAIEELVAAAPAFATREEHASAMGLLDKALVLDPDRLELHLDLAMLEEAMGRRDAAVERIEALAERYVDDGCTDEAAELLRFLTTWAADDASEPAKPAAAPAPIAAPAPTAAPKVMPWLTAIITGETVLARNPLLPPAPVRLSSAFERELDLALSLAPAPTNAPTTEPEIEPETTIARAPAAPVVTDDALTRVAHVRQFTRKPAPAAGRRTTPPPLPIDTDGNPLVGRLRARAGFHSAASPHRVEVRATEPISIRPAIRTPLGREEDVTVRYRRPRGLDAAS